MEKETMLIDTNIFIDYLRNFKPAIGFFQSIIGRDDVYFSAITEAEIIAGNENDDTGKREKLLHFLHRWNKIPVDNPLVILAGDLSRNHKIAIPDAIIAATALTVNAKLLTKNVRHFNNIANLRIKSPY